MHRFYNLLTKMKSECMDSQIVLNDLIKIFCDCEHYNYNFDIMLKNKKHLCDRMTYWISYLMRNKPYYLLILEHSVTRNATKLYMCSLYHKDGILVYTSDLYNSSICAVLRMLIDQKPLILS